MSLAEVAEFGPNSANVLGPWVAGVRVGLCTNLRVKLGAKSRFEAVMAATRLGILVLGEQRLD